MRTLSAILILCQILFCFSQAKTNFVSPKINQ